LKKIKKHEYGERNTKPLSQFEGGINMLKENKPLLSDEFLDELANEINQLFGSPTNEQNAESINTD
jgi:hypothetical protein